MNEEKQIIPIIKYIKDSEEKKYGIKIELETPTIMEYYKKNIKGNDFDLLHFINVIVTGLTACGLSKPEEDYICIFDKHQYHPIQKLQMPNLDNILHSLTIYHEIRHILQYKKPELFSDYELFCIKHLRLLNNRYIVSEEYHDSQYFEIDANIYGCEETKKLFRHPNAIKYVSNSEAEHIYKRSVYSFDDYFNIFLKENKNGFDEDLYSNSQHIKTFWNQDGSFKELKEIARNMPNNLLTSRILTSEAFLSSLNKVTIEEKAIIIYQIEKLISHLSDNINTIYNLYKQQLISEYAYQIGIQFIENEINKKENNSKVRILKEY